jgi:hypothetical protein
MTSTAPDTRLPGPASASASEVELSIGGMTCIDGVARQVRRMTNPPGSGTALLPGVGLSRTSWFTTRQDRVRLSLGADPMLRLVPPGWVGPGVGSVGPGLRAVHVGVHR